MKRDLKIAVDQMIKSDTSFRDAVSWFKKKYLQKALEITDGDPQRAAKAVGMDRDSFRRKAKKYKLKYKKKTTKPRKQKPAKQR
jgi:DNA-binding NtrC family response regulator